MLFNNRKKDFTHDVLVSTTKHLTNLISRERGQISIHTFFEIFEVLQDVDIQELESRSN
jgi:hypothetical protein